MDHENLSDTSSNYVKETIDDIDFENTNSSLLTNEMYDPSSKEFICCIEMINNNKLYIRYELDWSMKDVNKL